MRIALNIDRFLPARGGGERYLCDLARALAARGHEVHVFAHDAEAGDLPVKVHRVPINRLTPGLRLLTFARNSARLIAAAGPFDVVHAVGKSAGMNLYNPHGGVEQAWLGQHLRAIENPAYRWFAGVKRLFSLRHHVILQLQAEAFRSPAVKKIIAISDMVKADIQRWHGTPEKRIEVIYNGVDLDRFHPRNQEHRAEVRARHGVADQDFLLLFVGNNFRLKGVATIVRALALLEAAPAGLPRQPAGTPGNRSGSRRVRALIVGRDRPGRYRRLARRLGVADRLVFTGGVRDVPRYYGAAEVYVHPTYYDACSLAVFEALASGLPAITTRYNGAAGLMVDGREGFSLDDPEDAETLAARIVHYYDPSRLRLARVAARRLMESHSAAANAQRVIEVYEEVVSGRAGDDPAVCCRSGAGGAP
ncbi:MAG: glycosyltransferase family 4 protein [Planctomycetes bacterium]|nr:glycosyltransferase family 4 protein [Planctomycetota bacterium]